MEGKVVGLGDAFFDDDYGSGDSPPLHPRCVCDIVPILEGETIDEETGTISEGE